MQSTRVLAFSANLARYAPKYPRPRPGTAERPPYRAPDPLTNNPKAVVTKLENDKLTFIHRPPPTAPTPYSLTTAPASPLLQPLSKATKAVPLPPPVRAAPKSSELPHLPEEELEKIRELRKQDPFKYTRGKLAKMFNVSQTFVGLLAPLKKSTRKATWKVLHEKHERDRAQWSERHTLVKAIRAKRRQLW